MTNPAIKTTTLQNGVKIVVNECPGVGFVKVGIWVRCGSVDEPENIGGISHFLEHMVFKGTKNHTQDEFRDLEKTGCQPNAYTSQHVTAFHNTVFPEDFAKAFDFVSDMVLYPTLRNDFDKERGAVLQEMKLYEDDDRDVISNAMFSASFEGHALGRPIIGTNETVSAMKPEDLIAYHAAHYNTSDMVLSVSGDVTFAEVEKLAAAKMGAVPGFARIARSAPVHTGGKTKIMVKPGNQLNMRLTFPGMSSEDPDRYAAEILSYILSHRLELELNEKRRIACGAGAGNSEIGQTGLFLVVAGGSPDAVVQSLPVICREIRDLAKGVSEKELQIAQSSFRMSFAMGIEKPQDMCDSLGQAMLETGAPIDLQKEMESYRNVTSADVARVAKKIFSAKPSLVTLGPVSLPMTLDEIHATITKKPATRKPRRQAAPAPRGPFLPDCLL